MAKIIVRKSNPLNGSVRIDGAKNAALFAVQIGATFNKELKEKYVAYRKDMADKVLADNAALQAELNK